MRMSTRMSAHMSPNEPFLLLPFPKTSIETSLENSLDSPIERSLKEIL